MTSVHRGKALSPENRDSEISLFLPLFAGFVICVNPWWGFYPELGLAVNILWEGGPGTEEPANLSHATKPHTSHSHQLLSAQEMGSDITWKYSSKLHCLIICASGAYIFDNLKSYAMNYFWGVKCEAASVRRAVLSMTLNENEFKGSWINLHHSCEHIHCINQ